VKYFSILGLLAAAWVISGFTADRQTPRLLPAALVEAALTAETMIEADPPSTMPRVALQAGHWLAAEAPDELARIRSNGTRGGGLHESEVTLRIAELAAEILAAADIVVDVLPATVPPSYHADLFISIHADGHNNTSASGFSVAAPRRDQTGVARDFVEVLAESYGASTGLRRSLNVTRQMENYYAFNWRRYTHSIDPRTVAVIIETGFLTSPSDRRIIVDRPELSAQGIAEAVLRFLDVPKSLAPVASVE